MSAADSDQRIRDEQTIARLTAEVARLQNELARLRGLVPTTRRARR